jgi:uncharacterized protein YciI
MLYDLICTDKTGSTQLRSDVRPRHLAYIAEQGDRVKIAGPFLGADGATMTGSLLIIDAVDEASARDFAASDPYALAGLFASVDIRPWRWTIGAPKE